MLTKITGLKTEGSSFDSGQVRGIFPVSKTPRPSLGLTYLTGYGNFFHGVERPGCQAYHKTWPRDKEKNVWSCISAPPSVFMLRSLGIIKHKSSLAAPFSVEYWNSACKWKAVEGSLPQSTDHVVQRKFANLFDTLHLKKEIFFFASFLLHVMEAYAGVVV